MQLCTRMSRPKGGQARGLPSAGHSSTPATPCQAQRSFTLQLTKTVYSTLLHMQSQWNRTTARCPKWFRYLVSRISCTTPGRLVGLPFSREIRDSVGLRNNAPPRLGAQQDGHSSRALQDHKLLQAARCKAEHPIFAQLI